VVNQFGSRIQTHFDTSRYISIKNLFLISHDEFMSGLKISLVKRKGRERENKTEILVSENSEKFFSYKKEKNK